MSAHSWDEDPPGIGWERSQRVRFKVEIKGLRVPQRSPLWTFIQRGSKLLVPMDTLVLHVEGRLITACSQVLMQFINYESV